MIRIANSNKNIISVSVVAACSHIAGSNKNIISVSVVAA